MKQNHVCLMLKYMQIGDANVVSISHNAETAVPDPFEPLTKSELWLGSTDVSNQVNHTTLWMETTLFFAHLSFLFVLQFAHSVKVKGKTHLPNKSYFCARFS